MSGSTKAASPSLSQPISALPYARLKGLANRLDMPCAGNQLYWRRMIEVMPEGMYDPLTVNRFAMNAHRLDGSPGYALLTDMGNRGVTFGQLIDYLKSMRFDVAMRELGYREEIRFTSHPEARPAVEGQRLELSCEATGVPGPSFLWFKEREPLPTQTSNKLVIEKVSQDHEGNYCCRASNEVSIEFSNWVEVTVHKPHRTVLPKPTEGQRPEILTQPQPEVVVQPGQELRLVVVAHGHDQLSYKWYCEDQPLPYGTSRELVIPSMTQAFQGTYTCSISSPSGGSVMSNPARVIVSPPQSAYPPPPLQPPMAPPQPHIVPPHYTPSPLYVYPEPAEPIPEGGNQSSFESGSPLYPQSSPPITSNGYHPHREKARNVSLKPLPGPVDDEGPRGQDMLADPSKPCYDKVALLIGNRHYHHSRLKLNTPETDTQDLTGILRSADFKVVSLVNLTKQEMDQAVDYFASLLGKNVYALFFFAGHGFELDGMNYMMAVDATMDKNPAHCLCAQKVQHTMQSCGAKLSIVLLDMCRVRSPPPRPLENEGVYRSPPQQHNGYFVYGFSCSPAERAYEISHNGPASSLTPEEKENSIFVAALKEHVQKGTLNTRIDRLLTDAAEGVRKRGAKCFPGAAGTWQKPEIRSNLGESLSLADHVSRNDESLGPIVERLEMWKKAHTVPGPVVVSCNDGQLALRLHFEAEHTNVLVVTAELLNGCLASAEIEEMTAEVVDEGIPALPCLTSQEDIDPHTTQYCYGHDQKRKKKDLMHFRIPDIQKLKSSSIALYIRVSYYYSEQRSRQLNHGELRHQLSPPPLYAQVVGYSQREPLQPAYNFPFHPMH